MIGYNYQEVLSYLQSLENDLMTYPYEREDFREIILALFQRYKRSIERFYLKIGDILQLRNRRSCREYLDDYRNIKNDILLYSVNFNDMQIQHDVTLAVIKIELLIIDLCTKERI
jgi:hypothetical protein